MGWAMNDLRSNRKLAPVPDPNRPTITRTPPRSRPAAGELDEDTKELKRRRKGSRRSEAADSSNTKTAVETVAEQPEDSGNTVEIKIDLEAVPSIATEDPAPVAEVGPDSRPARRRDADNEDDDGDKFPWHHQFEDDEPEELQATSPLLSRAFRATTG